ncbi:12156_t:CDS:2 [Acaulospora colombiana]|uniref:12156_t:CDS:1 n=1 Tax=Acaulospora colombiana TaxID=27376 RepID=A0ACA9LKI0_9GLOM|nr:12156_t:CDS:2 [Acaulospora colombiana]
MSSKKLFHQLSYDLTKLYSDLNFCDVTVEIGKSPNLKIIKAHSAILYYRSPYFRRELSKPDFNNMHKKFKFNIAVEIIEPLIKYIYDGTILLDNKNASEIFHLLSAAEKLCLRELVSYLQQHLLDHHTEWLKRHFKSVRRASFRNDAFQDLQRYCTDMMLNNPDIAFRAIDFRKITEQALVSLLERNDFRMEEVQIWENVIDWGIAQNPALSSDPSNWSAENYNELRSSLQRFLPLIRFQEMTCQQFFEKVQPLSKLLDPKVYEDLEKYFTLSTEDMPVSPLILSTRRSSINSLILTDKHVALISIWIRQSESNLSTSPAASKSHENSENRCELKLLLRGTRDGFSPSVFHQLCDSAAHTIVVFKVKDTGELLGGYNPIKWKSARGWGQASNSFIFSLGDDNIKNSIISRVKRKNMALNYEYSLGPSFGNDDITINGQDFREETKCYSENHCYERPIRKHSGYFSLEEYEVFQVNKI